LCTHVALPLRPGASRLVQGRQYESFREQNTARHSADTALLRAWREQAAARRPGARPAAPREQARQRVWQQAAVARAQLPVAQRVLPACAPPRAASEANAGSLKQRR